MIFYFYSRVSTVSQNTARQIENFKLLQSYDPNFLFIDKVTGNIPFIQRPEASKLFDELTTNLNEKKTLVVDSIDRLGRNLLDILNTIELFTKNNINLSSIKEGFQTLLENGKENPMAKIVIACMGSIAEMERNRIKQRVSEGVSIAKSLGKYKGRKFGTIQSDEKLISRYPEIIKKLQKGLTIREISSITGKSSTTIIKVKRAFMKK